MDQKKIILIALLAVLFVYVDYRFVFAPQLKGIKETQAKVVQKQKDLDLLHASLPRLNELANKEKQAQATISNFSMKFVSEDEIVSLLQRISEIADKYRVSISEIKPSKQGGDPRFGKNNEALPGAPLLITLSGLCDYHNLGRFLGDLESMEIYIAVETFKITPQQTDSLVQKVHLVLKTYVE